MTPVCAQITSNVKPAYIVWYLCSWKREKYVKLLHELVGSAAGHTIFRRGSVAPKNPAESQLSRTPSHDASSPSNLSVTDVAVLAYMWQAKFFTANGNLELFSIISSSLHTSDSEHVQRVISSSLHTSDSEHVQRVLEVGRTGKWRPGHALTQNVQSSLGLDPKGQDCHSLQFM